MRRPLRPATVDQFFPPREITENTKARRAWLEAKLAELLAAGRDAKIVGKGSYQGVSAKIVKPIATKQQVRGLCQACGGEWAIVGGTIAHHGYTRPEYGYQTQSCFGARYAPLEESCDRTHKLHFIVTTQAAQLADRIRELKAGTVTELTIFERKYRGFGKYETVAVKLTPEHRDWAQELRVRIAQSESELRQLQSHKAHLLDVCIRWEKGEYAGTTRECTVII